MLHSILLVTTHLSRPFLSECREQWHHAAVAIGGRSSLSLSILKARGMRTRREFADKIEVTEQTIYNWESGKTRPVLLDHAVKLWTRAGVPCHLMHPDIPEDMQNPIPQT
jgi:hypothetical protein